MKEPLHPGQILLEILKADGYMNISGEFIFLGDDNTCWAEKSFNIPQDKLTALIIGEIDIDNLMAYKISKRLRNSDMAFWLNLQKDYDNYTGRPVEFKTAEEWESLEHRKLNPKPGDVINDGVNKKTYHGNGVWTTTMLFGCAKLDK